MGGESLRPQQLSSGPARLTKLVLAKDITMNQLHTFVGYGDSVDDSVEDAYNQFGEHKTKLGRSPVLEHTCMQILPEGESFAAVLTVGYKHTAAH